MRWFAITACFLCVALVQPLRADIPGAKLTQFVTSNLPVTPRSLAPGLNGEVWFSEERLTPHSIGFFTRDGKATKFPVPCAQCDGNGTHLAYIESITVGSDGNLWFPYTEVNGDGSPLNGGMNSFIGRFTPGGQFAKFPIMTIDAVRRYVFGSFGQSFITSGPDGNLWFTENVAGKVGRITPVGVLTEFALASKTAAPAGITSGPDGNLWFTEMAAGKIGRISTAGALTEFVAPKGTSAASPFSITAGARDTNLLWFTDWSGAVGSITTTGVARRFSLEPKAVPLNITAGSDGKLYFPYFAFIDTAGNYQGNIAQIDPAKISGSGALRSDLLLSRPLDVPIFGINTIPLPNKAFGSDIIFNPLFPGGPGVELFMSASQPDGSGGFFDTPPFVLDVNVATIDCSNPVISIGGPDTSQNILLYQNVGESQSGQAFVYGATPPLHFSMSGLIPGGISFFTDFSSPLGTFVGLNGSAEKAGTYHFKLTVTDARPCTATVNYTLLVNAGLTTFGSSQPAPKFNVTPSTIRSGQTATITWGDYSAPVEIDNGIGSVSGSGSKTVSPSTTTTYNLTATRNGTLIREAAKITVNEAATNLLFPPLAMFETPDSGGGVTNYALINSGSGLANITLSQEGDFFTQFPTTFTLAPGAIQNVTLTGNPKPEGAYEGTSKVLIDSGDGPPSELQIPVKLLAAPVPAGNVVAQAVEPRVDIFAPPGTSPAGSVSFTNTSSFPLTGILTSDVQWITPQSGVITIPANGTGTFSYTTARDKRASSAPSANSAGGSILLSYVNGLRSPSSKRALDSPPPAVSVAVVKVVDTVQPPVTTTAVPPIGSGEIALYVAGAGHFLGSGGKKFVSDVNILNPHGSRSVDDAKMYYTAATGSAASSKQASLGPVPNQVSVSVADVVKTVFSGANELGTLQIRSKDAGLLSVSANVLATNNPSGTFGNAIPVFRSDRSVDSGATLVLTGLRKDSTTHTNLYLQETAGFPSTAQIDYVALDGSNVSSVTQTIDAFKLLQLLDAAPTNAVAAFITNTSTAGGKIAAYATPLDETSSDTWAIADWGQQLGYSSTEVMVVPVAGSVHGLNNTFYRTDLAVTNRGTSEASAAIRYISQTGMKVDRQITLGARRTSTISDVVGTFFNVSGDSAGFITFAPVTGSFAVSSRTFTTTGSSNATFGTGVPTLATSSALFTGGSRFIAGLADASKATVVSARAGTFRTNLAVMEIAGRPVTVRLTLRFSFPAGQKAQGTGSAIRDYVMGGNQFLMINSIASEALRLGRLQYGDLSNLEADFQVISGTGAVVLFTSSVDNGTGDSILRTD